jgi:restriction system protein
MLGKQSVYAADCFAGNFIAFTALEKSIGDVSQDLTEDWRDFNKIYIPKILAEHPERSKISAGLTSAFLWTISKGIAVGDIVLCPDGSGYYRVGEITGPYNYVAGPILQHRRSVQWYPKAIARQIMSEALKSSTGSIGTVSNISKHREELEKLIEGQAPATIVSTDAAVEDPASFVMEKHLEEFLVHNWGSTELGAQYDIYEENGELVGQQYETDTGPMDILAVRKDKKELLVVELKKGRASDAVVGQVLRYMGYVQQELADDDQTVKGIIIAVDDDQRIRRALSVVPSISFYRYQVSFKLQKT